MSSRTLPEYNQLMRFTINDVCNWLGENRFGEFVRMFREHGIDGNRFVELTDLDLTKIGCPMNKRRDLLKLIKDLPKPEPSRYKRVRRMVRHRRHTVVSIIYQSVDRVRNVIQPRVPPTPERDYHPRHARPPPPLPTDHQPQTNGESDSEDDDCQWDSEFESGSEEEDYMNPSDEVEAMQKKHSQTPGEESDESAASYEEPDPQLAPPVVPGRSGAPAPKAATVPVNRRPIPMIPQEEPQPVYEETSEEPDEQPVYADPDEQQNAPVPPPAARRQLPVPSDVGRKKLTPMSSEPDAPAPPPPRGGRGKQPPPPKSNKSTEQSLPTPPPPRGGKKAQPVAPQPVQEEFYEDPDNPPNQQTDHAEHYWEPVRGHDKPLPSPEEGVHQEECYEDPDKKPIVSVRNSALPPLPTEQQHTPTLPTIQQDVYEDPEPPNQPSAPQPPPPRNKGHKPPQPKKSEPEFVQLDYEVPEEIMKTDMPQEDYMAMAPVPPNIAASVPVKKEEKAATLPPRPGGKNKKVNPPPVVETPKQENKSSTGQRSKPRAPPTSNSVSLDDQAWYHGEIERSVADKKLTDQGVNGCYLIRMSRKGGEAKPYTLAIFYQDQVYNLNIRKKPNTKFALGLVKKDEQEFSDLAELVAFFNTHRLILAKGQTRLKTACPK